MSVAEAVKVCDRSTADDFSRRGQDVGQYFGLDGWGRPYRAIGPGPDLDPLRRGPDHDHKYNADEGLGVGLYIAGEVAKAHGAEIEAGSDGTETVFAVRLPRRRLRTENEARLICEQFCLMLPHVHCF